ncbi:hypothetical protein CEXT_476511 [Caerostris extrusa]|uniref:Uncharacterized protein n=1 Tax=Caerostris extrusa TaxID=172846 RepID=A0AAV4XD65_CAEEX|nr:hypothetical protein CEXT_476511 [Caerostris extrusa]
MYFNKSGLLISGAIHQLSSCSDGTRDKTDKFRGVTASFGEISPGLDLWGVRQLRPSQHEPAFIKGRKMSPKLRDSRLGRRSIKTMLRFLQFGWKWM